jgi:hypothetical protein
MIPMIRFSRRAIVQMNCGAFLRDSQGDTCSLFHFLQIVTNYCL